MADRDRARECGGVVGEKTGAVRAAAVILVQVLVTSGRAANLGTRGCPQIEASVGTVRRQSVIDGSCTRPSWREARSFSYS